MDISRFNLLRKWEAEATQISKSLGLVYSEHNPPPTGRQIGDVLPASNNAITHAYVSAKLAQLLGSGLARDFGDGREINQPPGPNEHWDTYKDMWNNEVGRRIGERQGALGDVTEFLKDAWRNGDLIVVKTDARIPADFVYSKTAVESFDGNIVSWRGPSPLFTPPARCFPGDTLIALPDGNTRPIRDIRAGDIVLSFDERADGGRGALVSGVVTKLFNNVTTEWLRVDFALANENQGNSSGSNNQIRRPLIATPGHEMLRPEGGFTRLDQMVVWTSKDSGTITLVNQDALQKVEAVPSLHA